MDAPRQLVLPFAPVAAHYRGDAFLEAPCNEAARRWLADPAAWPFGRLALCGEAGTGKTHLLHGWCERQQATWLDGAGLRGLAPWGGPLAIDDADLAPQPETLLHVLNEAAAAGAPVLLAGRLPAARWPVALADLLSRLRATVSVELEQPDDALLRALFGRLLAERQLAVSQAVQEWLLCRLPRNGAALREAACRLDHAALVAGRAVDYRLAAVVVSCLAVD